MHSITNLVHCQISKQYSQVVLNPHYYPCLSLMSPCHHLHVITHLEILP